MAQVTNIVPTEARSSGTLCKFKKQLKIYRSIAHFADLRDLAPLDLAVTRALYKLYLVWYGIP